MGTPSASPSPRPSPSPSASLDLAGLCPDCPVAAALPVKEKHRELGGYDSYKHCKNSRNKKSRPPPPDAVGYNQDVDPRELADEDASDCDEDDMIEPEEDDTPVGGYVPREEGTTDAPLGAPIDSSADAVKVFVVYKRTKVPLFVKPVAKGVDVFDAVERATGNDHFNMEATFKDRMINHYTPLWPFGFKDGDVVFARDKHSPQEGGPPPVPIRDEAEEMLAKLNLAAMPEVTTAATADAK